MRLLVVGQNPARPLAAPFDSPSGDRLAALFGVGSRQELAELVTLDNCVSTVATPRRPQYLAGAVRLREQYPGPQVVVACGRSVSAALGGPSEWLAFAESDGWLVGLLPHPSGRNRWWNNPTHRAAARDFCARMLDLSKIPLAPKP